MIDELENKLVNLIVFTLKGFVQADFSRENKIISFSTVIYRSKEIPFSVRRYVKARQGMTFRPHETFFQLEDEAVKIIQNISFRHKSTWRQEVHAFWRLAKVCHQMLMEIAIEERASECDAALEE